MIYLFPVVICISLNLLLLKVISSLNIQKISLNKSSIILICVILTFNAFISMEFGKFLNLYLFKSYSSLFGGVLLLFTGANFLIEHKKITEYKNGYDTSFYYETFSNCRKFFFTPSIIDSNNSKYIELNESIYISIPLCLCTFFIFFAAGTTLINIPFTLLLIFLSTMLVLCTSLSNKINILSNWLDKNCFFSVSIIIIIYGILQILI